MNIHIIPSAAALALAPYTMLIYCLHGNIMRITSKIPSIFGVSSEFPAFILAVVLTIIAIVILQIFLKKSPPDMETDHGGQIEKSL